MISTSSLVLDGPHGLGPAGPHHMGYEPYLRAKMPTAEFVRPLPKPAPLVPARYNGRPTPPQSPRKDFLPPSTCPSSVGPVNLAKDGDEGYAFTPRMFSHPGFFSSPYGGLYASPYSTMLTRPTYINPTPLSPLEQQQQQYTPPQPPAVNPAFRPPSGYSPQPPPPPQPASKPVLPQSPREKRPFKVPPGRETKTRTLPLRKRPANHNNNNTLPPNFTKGSLIQLGNGELRRVEDVTTEDLVSSAERCAAFRLDPSTVVRIGEPTNGLVLLTLSHGEHKRTVDIESTIEHPYFIYGKGWASSSPKRTLTCYGLNCRQLQVGDVCVSLSPRLPAAPEIATLPSTSNAAAPDLDPDDRSNKKRRWSAPDKIEDVDDEIIDPGSPSPVLKSIKE